VAAPSRRERVDRLEALGRGEGERARLDHADVVAVVDLVTAVEGVLVVRRRVGRRA
jgi:hypothetical protein